jgi:hypothetical protein
MNVTVAPANGLPLYVTDPIAGTSFTLAPPSPPHPEINAMQQLATATTRSERIIKANPSLSRSEKKTLNRR